MPLVKKILLDLCEKQPSGSHLGLPLYIRTWFPLKKLSQCQRGKYTFFKKRSFPLSFHYEPFCPTNLWSCLLSSHQRKHRTEFRILSAEQYTFRYMVGLKASDNVPLAHSVQMNAQHWWVQTGISIPLAPTHWKDILLSEGEKVPWDTKSLLPSVNHDGHPQAWGDMPIGEAIIS